MPIEAKAIDQSFDNLVKSFYNKRAEMTKLYMRSYPTYQATEREVIEIYQEIINLTVERVLNSPQDVRLQIMRNDARTFVKGTGIPQVSLESYYESVIMEILNRISPHQQTSS